MNYLLEERRSRQLAFSLFVLSVAMPLTVYGDADAGASASTPAGELQEVVVTARKQTERLQDVPISITAVSSETLERSGAMSIADIGREVPALNVVSVGPGQNQLIIRGVSSSGGGPTVGYYIDETPVESGGSIFEGNALDPALFDLERVEVLRGPQGTLYGAASMGGTVKFVTKQPDVNATEGTIRTVLSGTDGGGGNYEAAALMNEPVIPGYVGLRVAAFYRDEEGYIDRYPIDPTNILALGPGPVAKNINTEKTYGTRLALGIKAGENFTVTPSVWLQRTDLGAPFTVDSPPGSFDNLIQTRDVSEPVTDELGLVSLTVDGNVQGVHLTSATAYRDRLFDAVEDESKVNYYYLSPQPQTYVFPSPFANDFSNHDFTEEIRASGSVGRVHALVGLFYSHYRNKSYFNQPVLPGYNAAFGTNFDSFFVGTDENDAIQRAAFGEINIDVTPQLQATVGARVFEITETDQTQANGVFNGGATAATGGSKDNGTDPKYELSYHATPDILTYATAAKGFRQGGSVTLPAGICDADLKAIGLSSPPTSFKSDSLWNYELGAKTAWLNNRLTVNGAVYYIDWVHVQQLILLPTCGFVFTGNFGKAESKGGELEVRYEPVPALTLTLGGAYNEATLTQTVSGAQGQPGDTLENAPRWMGSATAEYRREFSADTSGYARFDFSTTSHQYNNFNKTSIYYSRAGYSLANLRFGVRHGIWDTALFVDNVFDKHAETALPLSYAIDLPITRRLSINRPRTVGLDLRVHF